MTWLIRRPNGLYVEAGPDQAAWLLRELGAEVIGAPAWVEEGWDGVVSGLERFET